MTEELKARIAQINAGTAPAGYKKTKVGIVPEEWDNELFSNIFSEQVRHTNDFTVYPLYSLTIEDGVVPKSERYERSHLVKKEDVFKVVSPDDFVYNPMNVRFGAVARYKGSFPVSVSGYYDVFSVNDGYSKEYMESFLLSSPMILYYNKVATGSLIEKQRVHFSQFLRFNLPVPPLPEQQKIAEILTAQDAVIALMQKQIELLQKQKKAFLQKMFPKKGCNVPEIRFAGFTDDWEQRKFGSLYQKSSEKNNGSIGIDKNITVATMQFKPDVKVTTEEYLKTYYTFNIGDIAFEGHHSKEFMFGRFVANDIGNGIVSHIFAVFRPYVNYDLKYWKYAIHNEGIMRPILSRCTKASTMMHDLVTNDFLNESILVPSIEEQRKIGAFLDNLDSLITLHQRKLEIEQQKKKALMQLLLTGKVRVKT